MIHPLDPDRIGAQNKHAPSEALNEVKEPK